MAEQPGSEPVSPPRPEKVPTLLLTGVVGSGKSTIAVEIHDILAELGVPSAAVDLDSLIWQWPSTSSWNNDLMFENLAAIWPNYAAHGANHLVLASELEDAAELERYHAAIPGAEITVCRLIAPKEMTFDLLRESVVLASGRQWNIARVGRLDKIIDGRGLEDFCVENGDRPAREVALEVLRQAEWVSAEQVLDRSD